VADRYDRAGRIDRAVDQAQRGTPAAPRPESRKPLWERSGMTRDEYQRGIKQLADERRAEIAREERLARARKGQSNPGND
jgi:hypothetical protein